MRHIKIFPTLQEYRQFIFSQIVTRSEFKRNKFYKGLVEFIIDQRSPIFFEASHEYEYAHFTQYFGWVLMRNSYDNPYLKDLYFLHDFVHMIFNNPLNPVSLTEDGFRATVVSNERVAANETEVMTYYRLPSLRNKTLDHPILYDFLKKKYKMKPEVYQLLEIRNKLIETDFLPKYLDNQKGREVVSFLKRFKNNNRTWTKLWRDGFPANRVDPIDYKTTLSLRSYGEFLENYRGMKSQKQYEENVLFNIRLGLMMLGYKKLPKTFKEALKMAGVFEGQTLMIAAASEYHGLYSGSKEKANREISVGKSLLN